MRTNSIEQDVNRIRLEIYAETKNMTAQQRTERVREISKIAAEKYGFVRIENTSKKGNIM